MSKYISGFKNANITIDSTGTVQSTDNVDDTFTITGAIDTTGIRSKSTGVKIDMYTKNIFSTSTSRDSSRTWSGVTLSYDGKYQSACTSNNNPIFVSSNYGVTWASKASSLNWTEISMSNDGKYQSATALNNTIYVSTDFGETWISKSITTSWISISVSSSGQYQTAISQSDPADVYTSNDYGNTWVSVIGSGLSLGRVVSISGTGKYQVAISVFTAFIYISSNFGQTWSTIGSSLGWFMIDISDSGQYITAAPNSSVLYVSSDYGVTFATKGNSQLWRDVSISTTGQYQAAAAPSGFINTSEDFGQTWTQRDISRNWGDIAISKDGNYCTALGNGINIYTWSSINNIIIDTNGNVGIGTTNPSQVLQVSDGARLRISNGPTDYTLIGSKDVDDSNNTRIVISGHTRGGFAGNIDYISTSTGHHAFHTGGSEKMRIANSGNVGIGATSPNFKLETNGDTRSTARNISTGGFLTRCGFVAGLAQGGVGVTAHSQGHGLFSVSGSTGLYYLGYVFWISNLNAAGLIPIVRNNINAAININDLVITVFLDSGTSNVCWNYINLGTTDFQGNNAYNVI